MVMNEVWRVRRLRVARAGVMAALLAVSPAFAQFGANAGAADARGGAPAPVDIDISLGGSRDNPLFPLGDNNGNMQNLVSPSEQDQFEIIIQHMADAVFEATDGLQRLRNVRFFADGRRANESDIVWRRSGIPANRAASQVGISGGQIAMFDVFVGGNADGSGLDFRATPEGRQVGGYILAQRWLSHALGIRSEFSEQGGDIPVSSTLMNDPHAAAATDNPAGLNLSVAGDGMEPFTVFENTRLNAQYRRFGAAAWETISRTYGDKKPPLLVALPERVQFPELLAGPQGPGGAPGIDLGGTTPAPGNLGVSSRSQLNILWDDGRRDIVITLDTSGSMAGAPLENAKAAARLVVDKAVLGSTSIAIVSFSDNVFIQAPLTPVDSEADRLFLRDVIDGLVAGGATNIGGGLSVAANLIRNRDNSTRRVVHLLTDGFSNTGPDEISVAQSLPADDVNVASFAFGEFADAATLQTIAQITDGPFFQTDTNLGDIVLAFDLGNAFTNDASNVVVERTFIADVQETFQFVVGPSATRLDATAVYDTDPAGAIVIFRDPNGVEIQPFRRDIVSGGATVEVSVVEAPTPGVWTLDALSRAGNIDFAFDANVIEDEAPVIASLVSLNGTTVTYPEPVILQAYLSSGLGISGVPVTGTVLTPNNQISSLPFFDDGRPPDLVANDGVYSANMPYRTNGFFEVTVDFDNRQGRGAETYSGTLRAPADGGASGARATAPPADTLLPNAFQRRATLDINATGIMPDDHGDVALGATPISADNGDVPGRIDRGGDIDVFSFVSSTSEVTVRVTELGDALTTQSIAVEILDIDGRTVLATATVGSCGYLLATAEVIPGLTYFARVTERGGAQIGTYTLSAGVTIFGDLEGSLGIAGGGGGGSSGCFIATAAYGTPLAPRIDTLRDFRDRRLLPNFVGAAFSDAYYRVSPSIAEGVASNEAVRGVVRGGLTLMLWAVGHPAMSVVVLALGAGCIAVFRRRRFPRS